MYDREGFRTWARRRMTEAGVGLVTALLLCPLAIEWWRQRLWLGAQLLTLAISALFLLSIVAFYYGNKTVQIVREWEAAEKAALNGR